MSCFVKNLWCYINGHLSHNVNGKSSHWRKVVFTHFVVILVICEYLTRLVLWSSWVRTSCICDWMSKWVYVSTMMSRTDEMYWKNEIIRFLVNWYKCWMRFAVRTHICDAYTMVCGAYMVLVLLFSFCVKFATHACIMRRMVCVNCVYATHT